MGILGTFLSLGWIGGNLIHDSIKTAQIDQSYNNQHQVVLPFALIPVNNHRGYHILQMHLGKQYVIC